MATVAVARLPQFKRAEVLDLKKDSRFSEEWLEQLICNDPGILGLGKGKAKVLSRQKMQKDGRIDLVLESEDKSSRFVVELMLGPLDGSHITRTIDYWLNEKNVTPKDVECKAVLIGERIADSRFYEAVKFLASKIPELIVKEVAALQLGNAMTLHFTPMFRSNELEEQRANVEQPPLPDPPAYWRARSKVTLEAAEAVIKMLREFDDSIKPNFNRHSIGLLVGNKPVLGLVSFRPIRDKARLSMRVEDALLCRKRLAKAGLQVLRPDSDDNKVRLAVTKEDVSRNERLLRQLCKDGYEFWSQ
jgi:hypothetical protein